MHNLPRLKKKVEAFLAREDGKISKENLLRAGILLGALALTATQSEGGQWSCDDHSNSVSIGNVPDQNPSGALASHSHSHCSHSSHGSHGQW